MIMHRIYTFSHNTFLSLTKPSVVLNVLGKYFVPIDLDSLDAQGRHNGKTMALGNVASNRCADFQ